MQYSVTGTVMKSNITVWNRPYLAMSEMEYKLSSRSSSPYTSTINPAAHLFSSGPSDHCFGRWFKKGRHQWWGPSHDITAEGSRSIWSWVWSSASPLSIKTGSSSESGPLMRTRLHTSGWGHPTGISGGWYVYMCKGERKGGSCMCALRDREVRLRPAVLWYEL